MKESFYNSRTGHIIKDKGDYSVPIGMNKRRHFVSVRAAMQAIRKNPDYQKCISYKADVICYLTNNEFRYVSADVKKIHATTKPYGW